MSMPRVRYFAYGSNMLTARLRDRCPSAVALTTAEVVGFCVGFHKRGVDASGKATLVAVEDSTISAVGAVFEIDRIELAELDRIEGSGYERIERFAVRCLRSGELLETHTYAAIEHHDDLVPYDWYLALVLAGIAEHGLGDDYAGRLQSLGAIPDEEPERVTRQEALSALCAVGIEDYRLLLRDLR